VTVQAGQARLLRDLPPRPRHREAPRLTDFVSLGNIDCTMCMTISVDDEAWHAGRDHLADWATLVEADRKPEGTLESG
jgi:hypothetical protein